MSESQLTNAWVKARAPSWSALSRRITSLYGSRNLSISQSLAALDDYRSVARDLASARRLAPGTRTTAGLESLSAQVHAVIFRKPSGGWKNLLSLLHNDVPAAAREIFSRILIMVGLMTATAAAGAWLINTYPSLISLVASEAMIEHVEKGTLWTDGIINVTPSSVLSLRILSNNIVVSLFAICSGVFFGLGTFYLIGLNGLMLGATFAFVHQHGLARQLLQFILAHGMVELSVICIAGAIGTTVGDALIRPIGASRTRSFRDCVRRMMPLVVLCALFLAGAGLIEGFISPDPMFPMASRVIIGSLYWLVMVLTMGGWLRRGIAADIASASYATGVTTTPR